MPGFGGIVGQERALRILGTLVAGKAVPHALLFTGIDGIGKSTTARALAMTVNCEAPLQPVAERPWPDACGRCRSCRRIAAGIHPDVIEIGPQGTFLKIGQIRALLTDLALKPYEARFRIVVLTDAHAMTPEAANALLKVLEEPPPQTILVLTAHGTADLLPTVVSRCQPIRFAPLSAERIAALLAERHGQDAEDALVLAALAGGSLSRAIALTREGAVDRWRRRRDWLAAILPGLERQPPAVLLAMAAELALDGKGAVDSLELAKTWLRDQIVAGCRPEKLVYRDRSDDLQRLAKGCDPERLAEWIVRLQEAQQALSANAAARPTLEALFFALARAGAGTRSAARN